MTIRVGGSDIGITPLLRAGFCKLTGRCSLHPGLRPPLLGQEGSRRF